VGIRGRPRNENIDRQVVAAVLHVLRTRGYKAVTMVGIARRVKRARASIYRRWPSKPHLVADCILSTMGASPAPDTGVLRNDLRAAVGTLQRAFSGPLKHALPGLVADMAHDRELAQAVRRQVLAPRRKSMRDALERARIRGEARADLDFELVLDLLAGPFYFRTLFGHARADRRTTRDVVDYVLKIVARPR
jgi:AcrR family transcriptional regulator